MFLELVNRKSFTAVGAWQDMAETGGNIEIYLKMMKTVMDFTHIGTNFQSTLWILVFQKGCYQFFQPKKHTGHEKSKLETQGPDGFSATEHLKHRMLGLHFLRIHYFI